MTVDTQHDRVYVADPRNSRIEVFDTKGKFLAKWPVPAWQGGVGWSFQDIVIDPQAERLYLISPPTDEVLVYDASGAKQGVLKPDPPNNLSGASALVRAHGKLYVTCVFSDQVQTINLPVK